MNLKKYAVFTALGVMALAGLALQASAQIYRAQFTLPVAAQWGAIHMQPGEYTLEAEVVASIPVIHLSGNGMSASVLTGPIMRTEPSDSRGHLELTEVNGAYAITKLVAATTGKEYSFAVPKNFGKAPLASAKMDVWAHRQ